MPLGDVNTPDEALGKLAKGVLLGESNALTDILGNPITLPSSQLDSSVKIQIGSYTGNGSKTRTLSFQFPPMLVVITEDTTTGSLIVLIKDQTTGAKANVSYTGADFSVAWTGNSVTLSAGTRSSEAAISNYSGSSYHYLAIGNS